MSEEKINHAPEDAAAAAEAELNAKLAKPSLMDIFVRGARKGWNIAIDNIIPNVLMAYVCIKILNVTGLLTLAGKFFAPVMAIWGLPGEAIMVLFSALMSMGGAVGVCMALYNDGGIDERSITIVIPAIYLLGSKIQYLGRFVVMLTDPRSFLSYPRHEYFRRTLCNLVGRDVENGEIPISEMERVNQMIEDISYYNAKNFFQF